MKTLINYIFHFLTVILASYSVSHASENDGMIAEQAEIQIELDENLLSIETRQAPLDDVIREIGRVAGFKTILTDDFVASPLLDISFDNLSVDEVVERLVSDENRIIFFSPIDEETGQRSIVQIWLLGVGSEYNDSDLSYVKVVGYQQENTIASGQENLVKGYKLIKLTKLLQQDQQVEARTRAAIALGKLKNEGAVFALESALLDQNASVRSEAISALGQIGGERATMILGNTLLNSGIDISQRVMAAQALWQVNSQSAKNYLRAGAYDVVNPVKTASSNPSSSTSNQTGSTEAQ